MSQSDLKLIIFYTHWKIFDRVDEISGGVDQAEHLTNWWGKPEKSHLKFIQKYILFSQIKNKNQQ